MYAFYIEGEDVKNFMNKLLRENTFDGYELRNVEIENIAKFEIDGSINRDYLNEDEDRSFCYWSEIKGYVFEIIKGNRLPKVFKVVLSLTADKVEILHPNGAAMFINIMFENDRVNFVTGTSQKNFSLDKGVDVAWEEYVHKFFKKLGLTEMKI